MIDPDLSGQTAVVTGSAKGVGREFLHALADSGADVAVHYRTSAAEAETVRETVDDTYGVDIMTVQADVTDPEEVDRLFDLIEAELGAVDILVNNVGAFAPRHWEELDHETWETVIETNLYGTYLCSKRALPGMREQSFGRIVNVGYASSEKGLVSAKNFPYFVAKTGVLMFTRMLAGDTTDDGITVNAVSPYTVENSAEFPDEPPRGRAAQFEEMNQALLFFLDEGSEYISGQNVEVSGGWLPESV